jgi:hypothetical protein
MAVSLLTYKLNNGYIDHWLVAGPQIIPIKLQPGDQISETLRKQFLENHFLSDSGITQMPVEQGPLTEGRLKIGEYESAWSYWRCQEDHLVNHSDFYSSVSLVRSWAYTQFRLRKPKKVMIEIEALGPVKLWINGELLAQESSFSYSKTSLQQLLAETNELLLCFEQVGIGECKHAFSLRIYEQENVPAPLFAGKVILPTTILHVSRRNELEQAFQYGVLKRDIFSSESGIELFWPEKNPQSAYTNVRLQTPRGRIYAEATEKGKPGDTAHLGHGVGIPEGTYQVVFMPVPREYYEENIRIQRTEEIWIAGNHPWITQPKGSFESRRREALMDASRRSGHLFAEIAKVALEQWKSISLITIEEVIHSLDGTHVEDGLNLLGLLGMAHRFGRQEPFPQSILDELWPCVEHFRFQPLFDPASQAPSLESDQFLRWVCELLAGQFYPDLLFGDGRKGAEHVASVEPLILDWLVKHGQFGFRHWDSDPILADTLIALSHLMDLANSETIYNVASALFDKILVGIALNSFHGGLSTCNGFGTTLGVKGALTQAISGISRLLWGQGIYNHQLAGYVSIACLQQYELPSIIPDLALASDVIEGTERHGECKKVTYRTGDYMLSSVQDYQPSEAGAREHIWQATLGPEAVIFTNHPGCASQEDASAPNFWLGNACLPRVAQLKNLLIAIYNIRETDRMNFTHAFFPIYAFDEYKIKKNWAFARKDDGYLALTASGQMEWIRQGQGAYRELRVQGRQTIWICQMGSKSQHGDFNEFQKRILLLQVEYHDLDVTLRTLHGERVNFGWSQPLRLNHQEVSRKFLNHYDYPTVYAELPARQMDVLFKDYLLRLNLSAEED